MLHATPFLRASDDDRERTVAFLNDQCARGRLSVDELGARVEAAYRAAYGTDLDALVADLPGSPFSPAAPSTPPARAALARRTVPTALGVALLALTAVGVMAIVPAEIWASLLLLAVPLGAVVLFTLAPVALPLLLVAWMVHVLGSPRQRRRW